jgi:ADP-ribose pyrophosphatase YjhB (NUDIX family)
MKITKIDGIYIESAHKMKNVRLDDCDYPKAIGAMIGVCTDAIIIDRENRVFYFPHRSIKPMKGYWSIGGRRLPGESASEAVARNFKRETSVKIMPKRFQPTSIIEVIWKDRKEKPTNVGKHDLIHVFIIELTKNELAKATANLCVTEYKTDSLEPFDRKTMVTRKIHPALLDIYDKVFPPER